ncbi:MAG TPA: serine/threonine-protein kinase [Gemmatimonadaceae bacterium]|nr:serine/threonine-protein kinase [Gemmatimonadaceae bacterium]
MNRCPTCGATYSTDARFCSRDGTRLLPAPESESDVPTREAPAPTLVGQTLDGRYEIVRKVGEGGMSSVYLATDRTMRERRAIKVLSAALSKDANAMERLRREASFGMRLAHPNVCHIIQLGETADGLVYVVMPFIEGEILSDRRHRLGQIPLDEAARLATDIAAGVHLAHGLQIIHRDLKPENVMVCRRPNGAEFGVVMDFGLAKERKTEGELRKLTATGIILGTPAFMSPEQLRGKPIDPRSDIYALGLLAYEMLTGKLPFQGRTQQEMVIARLRSEPMPLREARPDLDLPESVERVLVKAMQRQPDDRYQDAIEFGTAFAAASRGEEPSPPPSENDGLMGKLFGQ